MPVRLRVEQSHLIADVGTEWRDKPSDACAA
jgi:hypothetical protein